MKVMSRTKGKNQIIEPLIHADTDIEAEKQILDSMILITEKNTLNAQFKSTTFTIANESMKAQHYQNLKWGKSIDQQETLKEGEKRNEDKEKPDKKNIRIA